MADAVLLEKVEALLRAAESRGFRLLEYAEGSLQLRVAFETNVNGEAEAGESAKAPAPAANSADAASIASPGVGFLRSSHPAGTKFPCEGDAVGPGTVVALIQAGPLLQPVTASRAGHLGKQLVAEGSGVGFGTALFEFA